MKTKKKETPVEFLHGTPKTRRDFLSSGLIQFTAAMSLPSIYNVLAKAGVAEAAAVCASATGGNSLLPIVTLNLAGGAAMSANFVPHDQGRQPLPSYDLMGLGRAGNFTLEYEFANNAPFAGAGVSGMLTGIRETSTMMTRAQAAFVGLCVRSQDDSMGNPFVIDGLIAKAGRRGSILPNLGRNRNQPAYIAPTPPLEVRSYDNIANALGVAGSLSSLSRAQQTKLFEMTQGLNVHQASKLQNFSGGRQLASLVQCAIGDNIDVISKDDPGTNPMGTPAFAALWGLQAGTNRSSQDYVFASILYNLLKDNTGIANLNLGGYDYHNGTRTRGDQMDLAAGRVIGRILESFAIMGKKAFLIVTSDGAVTGPRSDNPGGIWTSDRGTAGAIYMIVYDPSQAPQTSDFQLGHFTTGQAADRSFISSGTVEMAAASVFANYLSFSGQISEFEKILPRTLSPEQMAQVLKIFG